MAPFEETLNSVGSQTNLPKMGSKSSFGLLWPFVIAVNLYDVLALCHLVPTHSLHVERPYMITPAKFNFMQDNFKKQDSTTTLAETSRPR